jgi:hypothetical protein
VDDEGLNSHGDLPHYSPSDYVLERDISGEQLFFKPPYELAEHMARHFKSCQLRYLRWPCSYYLLSGLSSTTSLDTRKCTNNSRLGHNYLLPSRLATRHNMRFLPVLHCKLSCGWSTVIVIFMIQPRQHLIVNFHRYMYHQTSPQVPSLRCDSFPDAAALLSDLTEARP